MEFPQILSAYDGVVRWINSRGLAVAGPPREVNFADFASAGTNEAVCDVAFPIEWARVSSRITGYILCNGDPATSFNNPPPTAVA